MVLLSLAAGGALFGIAGAILAVPVEPSPVNVIREIRSEGVETPPEVT